MVTVTYAGNGSPADNEYWHYMGRDRDDHLLRFWINGGQLVKLRLMDLYKRRGLLRLQPNPSIWIGMFDISAFNHQAAIGIGDTIRIETDMIQKFDTDNLFGTGAFRNSNNEVGFNIGNRLIYGGRRRHLSRIGGYFKSGQSIRMVKPCTDDVLREFADAVEGCNFRTREDAQRFLAFLPASFIAGAYEHSPALVAVCYSKHDCIWMLNNVVMPLFGNAMTLLKEEKRKELWPLVGDNSTPVVAVTDINDDSCMRLLLELLSCSRFGGERIRARPGGVRGIVRWKPTFATLLLSTDIPKEAWKQERLRKSVTPCWMNDYDLGNRPGTINLANFLAEHGRSIQSRLICDMPTIVEKLEKLNKQLNTEGRFNIEQNQMTAALTACYEWVTRTPCNEYIDAKVLRDYE